MQKRDSSKKPGESLAVDDVLECLRYEIELAGSQREWGAKHGVAQPNISATLNRQRAPSRRILKAVKLEKVTTYRKVKAK